MRKITLESVEALFGMESFSKSNTTVILAEDGGSSMMYLHGNLIAVYSETDNTVWISSAGWETTTTKERLNGILEYIGEGKIYQKASVWYRGERKEFTNETIQLG